MTTLCTCDCTCCELMRLTHCGCQQPPVVPPVDTKYPSDTNDYSKFKLQQPDGETINDLKDYDSEYFYLNDKDITIFYCPTQGKTTSNAKYTRSELREVNEWKPPMGVHNLTTHLKVPVENTTDQVIVSQIHNTNAPVGSPLLLIRWENGTLKFHYKKDKDGNRGDSQIIGKPDHKWFDLSLNVDNGLLKVSIDGEIKINMDISYWDYNCYFKMGAYTQSTDPKESSTVECTTFTMSHS